MGGDLSLAEAILLGVVQGVTEWLPVSSSGHLVLAQALLGVEAPIVFDLVLHLGTLLVVVFFYRAVIAQILRAYAHLPRELRSGLSWRRALWDDPHRRLGVLVVSGTIPTAIIGFTFRDTITTLFESVLAVAIALLVTGTFLWATKYARPIPGDLRVRHALLIGIAQGVAILPGVSRSGSTIGAATLLGVDRELAVKYSFLLSIPAIVGAAVLQANPAAFGTIAGEWPAYAAGTVAAMVVGYASLSFLVFIARRRGLHYFAYYCWAIGGLSLAWALSPALA